MLRLERLPDGLRVTERLADGVRVIDRLADGVRVIERLCAAGEPRCVTPLVPRSLRPKTRPLAERLL